jgi:DNA-binding PadR family transcriptional regulator
MDRRRFYRPTDRGAEAEVKRRLEAWARRRQEIARRRQPEEP